MLEGLERAKLDRARLDEAGARLRQFKAYEDMVDAESALNELRVALTKAESKWSDAAMAHDIAYQALSDLEYELNLIAFPDGADDV